MVENQTEQKESTQAPQTEKVVARRKKGNFSKVFLVFITVILTVAILAYLFINAQLLRPNIALPRPSEHTFKIEKFKSEDEFKSYLSESSKSFGGLFGGAFFGTDLLREGIGAPEIGAEVPQALKEAPERVSTTNVQVAGIDEPDMVKTNATNIFFSSQNYPYRISPQPVLLEEGTQIIPEPPKSETKVIKAYPPSDLSYESGIGKTGNLLLTESNLLIFSNNQIIGYDVTDPKDPKETWKFDLETATSVVAVRLREGKVYVVTSRSINQQIPCPIPLGRGETSLMIDCLEIYHPTLPIPVDVTFSILAFDPKDGSVDDRVSFVGPSTQSVIYMSNEFAYVTYSYYESAVAFYNQFLKEKVADLIPSSIQERLAELATYNISEYSKYTEMQFILEGFYTSLSADERKRIENELANRLEDYAKEHIREFVKTGIVKVEKLSLEVKATTSIAGIPLNQFSLDEYKGNLRVATTLSGGIFSIADSENDVYVLDENLSIVGGLQGLGLTERIYSVRFIEDKGYVVTFRQIDPFYVLDLSNPKTPLKTGELKIPGYSSYLHPITKDEILGVGQEASNVKLSLFDVSNPANPVEKDKYNLDEFWTQVSESHHAFLLDAKHKIFFLPAGTSGYIFSYAEGALSLAKVVADISAQRALYIDDFLYVIGDTKIVVLNETDFSQVNELTF